MILKYEILNVIIITLHFIISNATVCYMGIVIKSCTAIIKKKGGNTMLYAQYDRGLPQFGLPVALSKQNHYHRCRSRPGLVKGPAVLNFLH